MTFVRYRQWPMQGDQFQNELRQAFDRFFRNDLDQNPADDSAMATSQWVPRVDIKEDKDRFVLYADLPGIDPDDIEVSMDKGILTIKGERSSESTQDTDRFSRIERSYGSFHRRFALPDSADPEGIQARGRNGVLEIVIPKRAESAPRRIQVGRHEGRTIDTPTTHQ